jgi:Lipocalin-like domain
MKLLLLLLTLFPAIGFCQLSNNRIVGKWRGVYLPRTAYDVHAGKPKDSAWVPETDTCIFIFNTNKTASVHYTGNSKDMEYKGPLKFTYKILPGSIIRFNQKDTKTLSTFRFSNDTLYFRPYPPRLLESIELFYLMKFVKCN